MAKTGPLLCGGVTVFAPLVINDVPSTARVGIIGIGGLAPAGSPVVIDEMLEFSARHSIAPITETFPMSKINDAIERLRSGKARYRIVLVNDKA